MAQLDLTDQQKRQIDGLKEQMEQEMKPVHDAMRAKHEEMAALWSVDSPSEAAILAKADEVDALHKQARNRGIRFGLEVVNVLTPAQRQQLATLRAQGPGACGGPGMGPPPDGDDDRGRRGPRGRVRMGG
jgi:Spy/CpxP family protein refolding chaperone